MKIKIYFILCFLSFSVFAREKFPLKEDKQQPPAEVVPGSKLPAFIKLPELFSPKSAKPEMYSYDSVSHNWKPVLMRFPAVDDMEKMKTLLLDPVRFTIKSSHDSVALGKEIELTITAEYLDVHAMLAFQFEDANAYTLKMLMPKGFVVTGGTYHDFIQGKVDKFNPRQTYTIRGFFEAMSGEDCFKLLRGKAGAFKNDSFYNLSDHCINKNSNGNFGGNYPISESSDFFSDSKYSRVPLKTIDLAMVVIEIYKNSKCGTNQEFEYSVFNKLHYPLEVKGYAHASDCNCLRNCNSNDIRHSIGGIFTLSARGTSGDSKSFSGSINLQQTNNEDAWHFDIFYRDGNSWKDFPHQSDCEVRFTDLSMLDNNTNPTLTANPTSIFSGQSTQLTVSNCNGTTVWPPPFLNPNQITVYPAETTTYEIACSLNGCLSEKKYVTVNVSCPTINTPGLTGQEDIPQNSQTTITASGCNGTIVWYDNPTSSTTRLVGAGTYMVKCMIGNCSSSASTIVIRESQCPAIAAPSLTASKLQITDGTPATLTVNGCTGYSVVWNDNNGGNSRERQVYAGTYKVKCIQDNCSSSWSNEVTITDRHCETFAAPILTAGANPINEESTTTITATNCNGIVKWTDGGITGIQRTVPPGTYTAYCQESTGEDRCTSARTSITVWGTTCNYTIEATSNASSNPGSVSIGDELQFWSSISGGAAGATYSYQWMKDGGNIAGANSGYHIVSPAGTSNSGNYKLKVRQNGTTKDCYSPEFYVSISPCSVNGSLSFAMLPDNKIWIPIQLNKACTGCTITFYKNGQVVESGQNQYIIVDNTAQNRGSYSAVVASPGGCYFNTASINVDFPAQPNYQSFIENLYCDNLSGFVADVANPNVQQKARMVIKNTAGTELYTASLSLTNAGSGYWKYSVPIPEAYKDGNTYKIGVQHENNAYAYGPPYYDTMKSLSCCRLAIQSVETGQVCDPLTQTNTASFKFVNRNASIPLYYRVLKKKYQEFGGVVYEPVSEFINIPANVADNTPVSVPAVGTGEYKIELRQGMLTQETDCQSSGFFTIDCSPLVSGCRPPQITVTPADSVQEGLGIIPVIYANFLNNDGVKADTNANFVNAASFGGNSTLHTGDIAGFQNVTTEAWVNIQPSNTITVGQLGDGQKQRFLFNSKHMANYLTWNLSVGSNGVNLIELSPNTGEKRIALSYNYNLTGWHYISLVYQNNLPTLYIDGAEVTKASKTAQQEFQMANYYQVQSMASIGGNNDNGFKGLVDEVKAYAKARTAAEVVANKSLRSNTGVLSHDQVTAYFTFEAPGAIKNLLRPTENSVSSTGDFSVLNIQPNPQLNKIYQTANLDWYYKGSLVAGNTVKYTVPKEEVRVGSLTYTIKFLGAEGQQCETQKIIVVKPAQLSQLSGCFSIESLAHGNSKTVQWDDNGSGRSLIKNKYNGSGDAIVWKFEYGGGKTYNIEAATTGKFLTRSNYAWNGNMLLMARDNANPAQKWELKYIDSLNVNPVIRLYSNAGGRAVVTSPEDISQDVLLQDNENSLSTPDQNFRLVKTTCPTPPKPCVTNGKVTVEKLALTNPNAIPYLDANRDKLETFVNKYRKDEQVLEYAPSGFVFGFYNFIPKKLSNGTVSTDGENNYIARLSGYFCPPSSGQFIFGLTGTKARMYMSPNEDPKGKVIIVNNDEGGGWGDPRKGYFTLTQGRSYYYEILVYDTGEDDYQILTVDGPQVYNGTGPVQMQYFSSVPRDSKPKKQRSEAEACGLMPPPPSLSDDMPNVFVGDTLFAADFKIIVDAVSGANGMFSGNGHANVKYLMDTPIKVRFDGIRINDYYELVSGEFTTEYDKEWGNVIDADTLVKDFVSEVKTVAQAAEVFLKTQWNKIDPDAFEEYSAAFKEKLAEEYDQATAAAYAAVLDCAKAEILIIDQKRAACEGIPPDATACSLKAAAEGRLAQCKAQFEALESQRTAKLNLALQIIKETLQKIKAYPIGTVTSDMVAASTALNNTQRPTSATIVKPKEQFYSAGEFNLDDMDITRKNKIENYYKKEMAYNKALVGKYFSNQNENNPAKHKEMAESLVASDGSKVSKYILSKLPASGPMNEIDKAKLITEVEAMMTEQIFELLLSSKVYDN